MKWQTHALPHQRRPPALFVQEPNYTTRYSLSGLYSPLRQTILAHPNSKISCLPPLAHVWLSLPISRHVSFPSRTRSEHLCFRSWAQPGGRGNYPTGSPVFGLRVTPGANYPSKGPVPSICSVAHVCIVSSWQICTLSPWLQQLQAYALFRTPT